MRDLTVILKHVPGELADLGETLGRNDINMEGICGFPLKDEGFIHILVGNAGVNIDLIYFAGLNRLIIGVDNLEKAKAALEWKSNYKIKIIEKKL